jgi:protein TonB
MAVRVLGFLLSAALHAALALPFLAFSGIRALEIGAGDDLLRIEQGIAIEGLVKLGEAETTAEAQDMPLVQASQAQPPIEEVKAVKPSEQPTRPEQETVPPADQVQIIGSTTGPEQEIETADELPPPEEPQPEEVAAKQPVQRPVVEDLPPPELKQPRPKQLAAIQQIEQFAVQEQQSSGEERKGGDATLRAAYLGKLRLHLERHKVRPEAKATGVAVVKFIVDPSGKILSREIISSSGSKKLDDAALATIERSAPFPPFPDGISRDPVVVSVPFKFRAGR